MARTVQKTARVRTPQQNRARRKVERLVSAARSCFSRLGYAGTTMARIAREADVSVGTAYSYFKDKDDVLQTVLRAHAEELLAPAEDETAALPPKATLRATLAKLMRGTVAFHEKHAGLHRVLLERVLEDPRLRSVSTALRARGLDVSRRIARQFGGAAATRDVEATAQLFVGLLEFCVNIGLIYPSTVSRSRAVRVATDMIAAFFEKGNS